MDSKIIDLTIVRCIAGYHANTNYGHGLDGYNLLRDQTQQHFSPLGSDKFDNFTCGRIDLMGNIVTKSAPYLYPFVIEFSLIVAAILFVMWCRIGKNPRYWQIPWETAGIEDICL